jgi:hypothetical protein
MHRTNDKDIPRSENPEQPEKIRQELIHDFRDEDTETWLKAAIEIGQLGRVSEEFRKEHLADPTSEGIHSHRHSWAALASYLGTALPEETPRFKVVMLADGTDGEDESGSVRRDIGIKEWLQDYLGRRVIQGLVKANASAAEFGAIEWFETWAARRAEEQASALEERLRKMQEAGNARAVEGLENQIAQGKSPDQAVDLVREEARGRRFLPAEKPKAWALGSFLAAVSRDTLKELGLPLVPFVKGMLQLGEKEAEYVTGLPRIVIRELEEGRADAEYLEAAHLLLTNVPQPAAVGPVGWVDHGRLLERVDALLPTPRKWNRWDHLQKMLPPGCLHDTFAAWRETPGKREAYAVIRAAEDCCCDELRWLELGEAEKLATTVLALAMIEPGGPGGQDEVKLSHRIRVLCRIIDAWKDRNQKLLQPLVRILKVLLYRQLRQLGRRDDPQATCRRHVYLIQPLVAAWNLRGTVNKDLATIAVRAVERCFSYDKSRRRGSGTSHASYQRLLQTLLCAVPEESLLQDMREYARYDGVREHLKTLYGFAQALGDRDHVRIASTCDEFMSQVWGGLEKPAPPADPRSTEDWWPDRVLLAQLIRLLSRDRMCHQIQEAKERGQTDLDAVCEDCTNPQCRSMEPEVRRALRWLLELRERWHAERDADYPEKTSKSFLAEIGNEVAIRTDSVVGSIETSLARLVSYEAAIRDVADDPYAVVSAMRGAIEEATVLSAACRQSLPYVEREYVSLALESYRRELQERLERITLIADGEEEEEAVRCLRDDTESHFTREDHGLVRNWMLRRHMLREASPPGNWVLHRLLDWRFVVAWILAPYVLSGVLYATLRGAPGAGSWPVWGLPFLLILPGHVTLLVCYFKQSKQLPGGISRASLLLPQMVGALFFGIMQTFNADESWTQAFMGNPLIRALNLVLFLGASYFFVRHVMLKDQRPRVQPPENENRNRLLRQRALSILALGHWQAFGIISLFSMLKGPAMSHSSRAGLIPDSSIMGASGVQFLQQSDSLAAGLGALIPHGIQMGFAGMLTLVVYPWAILTWTVQIFFFSAIFERIMNGSGE